MYEWPSRLSAIRIALASAIAGIILIAANLAAAAQQVVMFVNGDPITAFDIEQRQRFLQLATNKQVPRQEVIDELIDEKLKLQLTKRFDFSQIPIDNQVEAQIGRIANGNVKALTEQLASKGVYLGTMKSRFKANLIWTQVIRGKYQSSFQFNEEDILKEADKNEDVRGYDYTLRPILFHIRRGSQQPVIEARRREAEGLRMRFQSCDEGIPFARALHDVTVRPQVTQSTANLPPALREILEKIEVGKLTQPELTPQGIELYALCGKKPSAADNTPSKSKAREKLTTEQFEANAKRYLKELRDLAYCVTPEGRVIKGCSAASVVSR